MTISFQLIMQLLRVLCIAIKLQKVFYYFTDHVLSQISEYTKNNF